MGNRTFYSKSRNGKVQESDQNISFWDKIVSFFTGDRAEETETATSSNARKNDKPNDNTSTGEVSELESELIGMIKTTGKEKNYELVEYVNDVLETSQIH